MQNAVQRQGPASLPAAFGAASGAMSSRQQSTSAAAATSSSFVDVDSSKSFASGSEVPMSGVHPSAMAGPRGNYQPAPPNTAFVTSRQLQLANEGRILTQPKFEFNTNYNNPATNRPGGAARPELQFPEGFDPLAPDLSLLSVEQRELYLKYYTTSWIKTEHLFAKTQASDGYAQGECLYCNLRCTDCDNIPLEQLYYCPRSRQQNFAKYVPKNPAAARLTERMRQQ